MALPPIEIGTYVIICARSSLLRREQGDPRVGHNIRTDFDMYAWESHPYGFKLKMRIAYHFAHTSFGWRQVPKFGICKFFHSSKISTKVV